MAIVKVIDVGASIIFALPPAIASRVISLWGLQDTAVRVVSVVLLVVVGEASIIFLDGPVLFVDTLRCVRLSLELVYSAPNAIVLILGAFCEVFPVFRVFLGHF